LIDPLAVEKKIGGTAGALAALIACIKPLRSFLKRVFHVQEITQLRKDLAEAEEKESADGRRTLSKLEALASSAGDAVIRIEAEQKSQREEQDAQNERLRRIESTLESHGETISKMNTEFARHDARVDNLGKAVVAIQSDIGEIKSSILTLVGHQANIEGKVEILVGRLK
jgi:chromosome segregation ATPase